MIVLAFEIDTENLFKWAEPEVRTKNLRLALNNAAKWTRTRMDREIRKQINYPASYLRPSTGNLVVSDYATAADLRVSISGRVRATSLARFAAKGTPTAGGNYKSMTKAQRKRREAVRVTVNPGNTRTIQNAFLVKLRGAQDAGNIGLAIKTDGGPPKKAYFPTPLKAFGPNVYLVYGPSVNQMLWSVRNQGGIIEQVDEEALQRVEDEFIRLMDVEFSRNA